MAIFYPHQLETRGENTVSVAQGATATPGATKQLLSPDRVFKRIIYVFGRSTKSRNIYIYIYIYCHPQTDCFVLSELFSVARHVGRSKKQNNKDIIGNKRGGTIIK